MNIHLDEDSRLPQLTSGMAWIAAAVIVLIVTTLSVVRVGRISGDEVGVLLNKWTGETELVAQSGQKFYISLISRLYVLDKTLQTLEMTVTAGRGERQGKDNLKVKTVDGSDVHVDVVVQYGIIPSEAAVVLATSGPGDLYKQKWARDYVRTEVRNHLGVLTTEDFYDATMRSEQIAAAAVAASEKLKEYGLQVNRIVLPTRPRFYTEYEAAIKKKKLADQQAQQEESKALAAIQKKNTEDVTATNKKNVAIEQYEGDVERMIIQAEADAGKVRLEADAYFERISIGATAALYQKTKEAEGILATKKADADGIQALSEALAGEGGRTMVKLEYAKRLQGVTITGQPYVTEGTTSRFAHTAAATTPAATAGKAK